LSGCRPECLLEDVFDDAREYLREGLPAADYERLRRDFAFHLTECRDDFRNLLGLLDHPGQPDIDAATTQVIGSLYHIIPHLKAAGRLLLDEIPDPFSKAE